MAFYLNLDIVNYKISMTKVQMHCLLSEEYEKPVDRLEFSGNEERCSGTRKNKE